MEEPHWSQWGHMPPLNFNFFFLIIWKIMIGALLKKKFFNYTIYYVVLHITRWMKKISDSFAEYNSMHKGTHVICITKLTDYFSYRNYSTSLFWVFLNYAVDDLEKWMLWGYYSSPMMYAQNAIFMNEFLDKRWNVVRSLGGFAVSIRRFSFYFTHFLEKKNSGLGLLVILSFKPWLEF